MSLKDSILAATKPGASSQCSVSRSIATLTKADAKDLAELFADPMVTSAAIGRGLQTVGVKLSGSTIARHRRGECHCGR